MTLLTRLLDSLCDRIGLRMVFDGDLCAPDGTEPWWSANPAITSIEIDAETQATIDAHRSWYERVMRLSQIALLQLPVAPDKERRP